MEFLLSILCVIAISAIIVDRLVKNESVSKAVSISLEEKEGINQQEELNNIATSFCKIFDAVYGEKTLSVRRMVYSVFLSTLFVIFSILIIGVENSYI